ncbi:hypothetical protein RRG08_019894 [Elysia crispata]|uniref:Uncharacterized protein n=1 Tax=Elysia crispata TaxID=231223 RepID=A0AAE0Z8F6_9GAST|nr:hypothetical protein RRG08_019894 [Elysia crispata]
MLEIPHSACDPELGSQQCQGHQDSSINILVQAANSAVDGLLGFRSGQAWLGERTPPSHQTVCEKFWPKIHEPHSLFWGPVLHLRQND